MKENKYRHMNPGYLKRPDNRIKKQTLNKRIVRTSRRVKTNPFLFTTPNTMAVIKTVSLFFQRCLYGDR